MEKPHVSLIYGGILDIRDFTTFNTLNGRETGDRLLHELKQYVSELIAFGIYSFAADGDEVVFWSEVCEVSDLRMHILEIENRLRSKYPDFQIWCGFATMPKNDLGLS